jgi:sensor histidine kinase YesM
MGLSGQSFKFSRPIASTTIFRRKLMSVATKSQPAHQFQIKLFVKIISYKDLPLPSGGIGLPNIEERLQGLYGRGLKIESSPGAGSVISFGIPKQKR